MHALQIASADEAALGLERADLYWLTPRTLREALRLVRAAAQARLVPAWCDVPPLLVAAGRPSALEAGDRLLNAGAVGLLFPGTPPGLEALLHTREAGVPAALRLAVPGGGDTLATDLEAAVLAAEDAQAADAHFVIVAAGPLDLADELRRRLAIPVLSRHAEAPDRWRPALGDYEPPARLEPAVRAQLGWA
jgi:hypothetical protein